MNELNNYFRNLKQILAKLLQVFTTPKIKEVEYVEVTKENIDKLKEQLKPNIETMQEKFIKTCLDALDTDVTLQDTTPDFVACAETVSTLIKKVFTDFPIIVGTKELDWKLFSDKRFQRITIPEIGCIVVSPSKTDPKGAIITHGHTGAFITSERIASNNSLGVNKGKFTGNYSWEEWIKYFKETLGLKIYLYKII
jgi:hypothetical protein